MNAAQVITATLVAVSAFLIKDLHSRISKFMEESRDKLESFSVRLAQIETRLGLEVGRVNASDAEYPSTFPARRNPKRKH